MCHVDILGTYTVSAWYSSENQVWHVGIPAHVWVSANYDPWFFLEERHIALGTGRTNPRTIWIDRWESRVDHQADPSHIPMNRMPGPQSGKTFSNPPNLTAIPTKGPISMRSNHRPQVTPWATKEGQGSQSPLVWKSLRKSILLPQRLRGYCRGPILGYPTRRG